MNILHSHTDPDLLTRLRQMLGCAAHADIAASTRNAGTAQPVRRGRYAAGRLQPRRSIRFLALRVSPTGIR